MLDPFYIKVFMLIAVAGFIAIVIKYAWLSRTRKSDAEMPVPFRALAVATWTLDWVYLVLSLGFTLLLFLEMYPNGLPTFPAHFALRVVGMALLVLGMSGYWWGMVSLGEFLLPRWTRLKHDHSVIKTGAYRYLRHPLYASRILAYLGLLLFFDNFLLLLVIFLIPLLYLQARQEEKVLIEVFGEEYKSYQAFTGMFFPKIFRKELA